MPKITLALLSPYTVMAMATPICYRQSSGSVLFSTSPRHEGIDARFYILLCHENSYELHSCVGWTRNDPWLIIKYQASLLQFINRLIGFGWGYLDSETTSSFVWRQWGRRGLATRWQYISSCASLSSCIMCSSNVQRKVRFSWGRKYFEMGASHVSSFGLDLRWWAMRPDLVGFFFR